MTQRCDSERIAELERRLEEALKEVAALREENSRLRKELEEWKRGHRERGKRRSSRPEGRRAGERLKPGRQAGHPGARRAVPKIDERIEYPAPCVCDCGGEVEQMDEVVSTIVEDIPEIRPKVTEHVAHCGRCSKCGKCVAHKLPGAVEQGQSIAQTQLGPNAKALILSITQTLRKNGLSVREYVCGLYDAHLAGRPPPSVFASF